MSAASHGAGDTLQFERSAADYRAWIVQTRLEAGRQPLRRVLYWSSLLAGGAIALALMFLARVPRRPDTVPADLALLVVTFFGAWSLINWLVAPLIETRFYPALDAFRAPHRIAFGPDALEISGPGISQSIAWLAISDVVETPQHVFIRVDRRSAVVVPQRAFADRAAGAAFVDAVRARLLKA